MRKTISLIIGLAVCVAAEFSVNTVYQFSSNDTWLENVAVRSNGIVLATEIGPPASLLAFDTRQRPIEKVVLKTFDTILGLSGITEAAHDVFYVTGANTTSSDISDPPANATHLWKVDFNKGNESHPAIDLVARPTTLTDFNGLAAYNRTIILGSASYEDSVYAFDVHTGKTWEVMKNDLMSDINGIKVQDGFLYWTSKSGFCRGSLHPNLTLSDSKLIVSGTFDDFAVSPDGFTLPRTSGQNLKYAYSATAALNTIEQIAFNAITGGNNETVIVAGSEDSTEVAEPTACAFGRAPGQLNTIFCTTGGASAVNVDVNGTETAVGAQLLALTIS